MMKLSTVIPYLEKIQKNILITWHTPWVLLSSAFFHWKSPTFFITRNTDIDCNLIHNSNCFIFFESLKVFFKHDYNLTMSTKLATLDFLKIKIFWSKGFDVVAFSHDVTNNILTRDRNCIVDVVMWPIFFDGCFYFFLIKDYFGKSEQIYSKKSLTENFIFYPVLEKYFNVLSAVLFHS